jgi:hypothetical protein
MCRSQDPPIWAPLLSGTECRNLREQVVGLGECRYRSQPIEQRSGLVENRRSFMRLAEAYEAAAVALESVGVFWDDAEPFPEPGDVGVAVRGGLVVASQNRAVTTLRSSRCPNSSVAKGEAHAPQKRNPSGFS